VVPNPTYHINTTDRAKTGNVVATTTADQIQYLIPMVDQAPGEYLVPVTRNKDYTYAPPLQPPAEYELNDYSVFKDVHGARLLAETYTRGCHWSPRMFASSEHACDQWHSSRVFTPLTG
jgi:hypothetical protein